MHALFDSHLEGIAVVGCECTQFLLAVPGPLYKQSGAWPLLSSKA